MSDKAPQSPRERQPRGESRWGPGPSCQASRAYRGGEGRENGSRGCSASLLLASRVDPTSKLLRATFSVEIRISIERDARTFFLFMEVSLNNRAKKKFFFSTQAVLAPNMDLTSVSPNASRTEGCSCSGNFRILERTLNALKKKKITESHI